MPGPRFSLSKANQRLLWLVPTLFFGILFYQPLVRVLRLGVNSNLWHEISNLSTLHLLWFTVWQAGISTLISLTLATPAAYILFQRDIPARGILQAIITIPFILPTIVVAIGFASLRSVPILNLVFNSNSNFTLVLAANVFMNFGFATRILGTHWQGLDRSLEEAMQLDGASRRQTFFHLTLRQLSPAYASAAFLIFLYCATNFGLILVLGGGRLESLETSVYLAATQDLDLGKAAALVLLQCLVTISAFAVANRFSNPIGSILSIETNQRLKKLGLADLPALFLFQATLAILIAGPTMVILIRSLVSPAGVGLRNYQNLGSFGFRDSLSISVGQAAYNSFRNALVSLFLSQLVGLPLCFLLSRRGGGKSGNQNSWFSGIFRLPVGVSSVALGLGYLITFTDGTFPLRSSWLVTPIAQSIVLIPLMVQLVLPAFRAIADEIFDAAAIDQATTSQIWWLIELPIAKKALQNSALFIAIVSIGEFGAANFLSYGDQATLPTVLYRLIARPGSQNFGMAMAASALLIIGIGAVILLFARDSRDYTSTD